MKSKIQLTILKLYVFDTPLISYVSQKPLYFLDVCRKNSSNNSCLVDFLNFLKSQKITHVYFRTVCSIPTIANGITSISENMYVNDIVIYNCRDGYALEGEANITCQMGGTLSSRPPSCVRGKPN